MTVRRPSAAIIMVAALLGALAAGEARGDTAAAGQEGAAAAPTPPPATAAAGATLDRVAPEDATRLMGRQVNNAKGENMGRIVDVLVDGSGRPRAAVIDFGGFLGVGSRKIAVDWRALRFSPDGKSSVVVSDLGRDQLKSAPEYKESGQPIAVVTTPKDVEGAAPLQAAPLSTPR